MTWNVQMCYRVIKLFSNVTERKKGHFPTDVYTTVDPWWLVKQCLFKTIL